MNYMNESKLQDAESLEAGTISDCYKEIVCKNCKKHICHAMAFDLEGTDFYCDDCFEKRLEIAKRLKEEVDFDERNKDTVRKFVDGVDVTEYK